MTKRAQLLSGRSSETRLQYFSEFTSILEFETIVPSENVNINIHIFTSSTWFLWVLVSWLWFTLHFESITLWLLDYVWNECTRSIARGAIQSIVCNSYSSVISLVQQYKPGLVTDITICLFWLISHRSPVKLNASSAGMKWTAMQVKFGVE